MFNFLISCLKFMFNNFSFMLRFNSVIPSRPYSGIYRVFHQLLLYNKLVIISTCKFKETFEALEMLSCDHIALSSSASRSFKILNASPFETIQQKTINSHCKSSSTDKYQKPNRPRPCSSGDGAVHSLWTIDQNEIEGYV